MGRQLSCQLVIACSCQHVFWCRSYADRHRCVRRRCASSQGADFGSQARKAIEHKLRKGMTLEEIEWRLKNPGQEYNQAAVKAAAVQALPKPKEAPKAEPKQEQQQKVEAKPPPPPPKAAAPPAPVEVGESMVSHKRDPLKLIKVG